MSDPLPENSESAVYQVMAIDRTGGEAHRRFFGSRTAAIAMAERIARSGDIAESNPARGAVSVWVEGDEGVVWAAGQKAGAMKDEGVTIDYFGMVRT